MFRTSHVIAMSMHGALLARHLQSMSMRSAGGDPFCSHSSQDMKEPGSTNVDPIFTNNKLPDGNEPGCAASYITAHVPCLPTQSSMTVGRSTYNSLTDGHACRYPGGIFDPFGFSKGNLAEYKLKELKNGR